MGRKPLHHAVCIIFLTEPSIQPKQRDFSHEFVVGNRRLAGGFAEGAYPYFRFRAMHSARCATPARVVGCRILGYFHVSYQLSVISYQVVKGLFVGYFRPLYKECQKIITDKPY